MSAASETQTRRYDVDELRIHANEQLTRTTPLNGFTGRRWVGRFPDNLTWVATHDVDGQIEMSFTYPSKRPSNADVMRALHRFGWTYLQEESRKSGKVRHFVIQKGYLN